MIQKMMQRYTKNYIIDNYNYNFNTLRTKCQHEALLEKLGISLAGNNTIYRKYIREIYNTAKDRLNNNDFDTYLYNNVSAEDNCKFCKFEVPKNILNKISKILYKLTIYLGYDLTENEIQNFTGYCVLDDLYLDDYIEELYSEQIKNNVTQINASIIISIGGNRTDHEKIAMIYHEFVHIKQFCLQHNLIQNSSNAYDVMYNLCDPGFSLYTAVKTTKQSSGYYSTDFLLNIMGMCFYLSDFSERSAFLETAKDEMEKFKFDIKHNNLSQNQILIQNIISENCTQDSTLKKLAKISWQCSEYIFYNYFLRNELNISDFNIETQEDLITKLNYINPQWKTHKQLDLGKYFKYNKNKTDFENLVNYLIASLTAFINSSARLYANLKK